MRIAGSYPTEIDIAQGRSEQFFGGIPAFAICTAEFESARSGRSITQSESLASRASALTQHIDAPANRVLQWGTRGRDSR